MRIRRKDLDLIAEAYSSLGQPQFKTAEELLMHVGKNPDQGYDLVKSGLAGEYGDAIQKSLAEDGYNGDNEDEYIENIIRYATFDYSNTPSEDAEELHPLLKEMEDEIFVGVTFQDFMTKATKALNQRYLPSRGMGLDYFLDTVGKLMKVELEYQPEDGGYVIAVDDLRSEEDLGTDEDAESKLPRNKLRFQSQAAKDGASVLDKPVERTGPPQKKFRPLSQFVKQ